MEKLETLLARWRCLEPQAVPLGRLKSHPMFQPRDTRLAPYRDRGRLESESERHVDDLASKLEDGRDLEPVLAARIDGKLWLIDGHHRLKAYRRRQRSTVPARIMDTTRDAALMVSKAVNCDGVKLPMHAEQKREAAWQYLAMRTNRGRRELPDGESLRAIGRTFGVGKDTMARMHREYVPKVNPSDYSAEACDPGTGWPQWKHVKGNAWRDAFDDADGEARERHKDERRAAKLATMIERDGLDAFLRSVRLLAVEAASIAAEQLEAAHGDTADDTDY